LEPNPSSWEIKTADHDPPYAPRVEGKAMIGLFFEVIPLAGHASRYFELAAALRPELERSGGVLFIDRYASVDRFDVILSHQWWADEESLIRWRAHTQHRAIQRAGREQHFRDYRLRIGPAVDVSRAASAARSLFVSYHDTKPATPVSGELFKSVYREEKYLVVSEHAPAAQDTSAEHKAFEITRDYTMHERTEAPQEYPPVMR
jgi:heme-degrading monooxygenase HmoA